jgi:putative pyruvate formate lyase activating enzyme
MNTLQRYTDLYTSGELDERIDRLDTLAASCSLCPRVCSVNRKKGERGICGAGDDLTAGKFLPHFGEEPVLTGTNGSGTIFFSYCNLSCHFCQNYQVSQEHLGFPMKLAELAAIMLRLQEQGCHNINLVSPTHFLPQIMKAVKASAAQGLTLPLVYNTNGYERVEVLKLLDGIIDIYLPDAKYGDDSSAQNFSNAPHYTSYNLSALKEMFRQVGLLKTDDRGIAERGIIIRHLVLPHDLAKTEQVLMMIREHLGKTVHISLMGQYFPTYQAFERVQLNRKITREEYQQCITLLEKYGFENGWFQNPDDIQETFVPDFTRKASWN